VIALTVLIIFFSISACLADRTGLEEQLTRGQKREELRRQFVRLLLFTIFLLYPLVSKTTLGVYNCVTVEGVSYLVADFQLNCYDSTWRTYAIIDGVFVALYPIGIPLVYSVILYRSMAHMREPETILVLGFLYEAYSGSAWYWELIDMTHKLLLTSVIVFVSNEARMACNMGIMGFYTVWLLLEKPYVRKGDDRFHLLVQATLFSLAFSGDILLQEDNPYSSYLATPAVMENLIACLLILIVLFLLLSFVVIAGGNIVRMYKMWKKEVQRDPLASQQRHGVMGFFLNIVVPFRTTAAARQPKPP